MQQAEGDLLRWLEHLLARMALGLDLSAEEGSREKEEAVSALRDIRQRMQAIYLENCCGILHSSFFSCRIFV